MMKKRSKVFSVANQTLPYNTNVVATIRTEDNNPVYSKAYPHPMGVADFVNKEIKDLLKSKIITPSRSPYNNPTWVVDKKGSDETGGRKKRLVIDFRKLNEKTIPDKYPLPSIELILANLGKAKYFTTLDLKSENFVADALSRQNINALQNEPESDCATVHSEESSTYTIETTEKPLNCFKNQIVLEEAKYSLKRYFIFFGNKCRHIIHFTEKSTLFETLRPIINPKVVNAIHCNLPTLASIQHALVSNFPATKFWHC
ncbi:hypothetical protein KR067_011438, partial [Drosophila pandora]